MRRPMPWDGSPAGGFTGGTPWLRLPRDSADRNVQRRAADPDSVLNFYRSLLRLRRASGALASGGFQALDAPDGVLAYAPTDPGERLIVVLNFTDRIQQATVGAVNMGPATVVLGSHKRAGEEVGCPRCASSRSRR